MGVESIGVGGFIHQLSSQGRSLTDSNLLLVLIGVVNSVDFWRFIICFCDVLFAICVSVKILSYHLGRNRLCWSTRSLCCVGSAWVVLMLGLD